MINVRRGLAPRTNDLLAIAVILVTGIKVFTLVVENTFDIGLYDESSYLHLGAALLSEGFPEASGAPLYALWYFFLSLLAGDRVSLYYLNYELLIIILPVLIFILLRKNQVSILISLMVSGIILFSRANIATWPRVSHLGLILTLVVLIFASGRTLLWASFFAALGALLISYIRPEFFLAFILCSVLFVVSAIVKKGERHRFSALALYGVISALLLTGFGLPILGGRSFIAFGQHFSLNWTSWTENSVKAWTNWQEITTHSFGSSSSIWQAFLHNPTLFLKHVFFNLWHLVGNAAPMILPPIVPINPLYKGMAVLLAGMAILLVLILCFVNFPKIRNILGEHRIFFVLAAVFLVPGFVSAIIIYPRSHYLLPLCVLTIVVLTILMDSLKGQRWEIGSKGTILLGALLVLIAVIPGSISPLRASSPGPNYDTIHFIRALEVDEAVTMLEAEGGYYIYLGNNFQRIAEYEKDKNFYRWLQDRSINMIVISDTLMNDTRFKDDPEWYDFLENYANLGFVQMDVPNTNRKVIIQASLLHEP